MHPFESYSKKFPKSKELFEKSCTLFPRGVCHDIRFYPPFPVVVERSEGAYITDADGNRHIDLWCGHYANIMGHSHPAVAGAVAEAVTRNLHPGSVNTDQIAFGELLQQAVPELERVRLCTSGTEATMYVSRLARAATGKQRIAKMQGGWHGGNADLTHAIKHPFEKPASAGIDRQTDPLPLPYNEVETTREILSGQTDIAAIILEPVLGSGGGIAASSEYLAMLRSYCDETGALLIYDEVITGFRFRYGSIWPDTGVRPDLFTFGKVAGGGMALGAYGGRKELFEPIEKRTIISGGGTFSAHPATMAAGRAVLTLLQGADYAALNASGDALRADVNAMIAELKIPACMTGHGSFFALHFFPNSADIAGIDVNRPVTFSGLASHGLEDLFKAIMLNSGVYTMHGAGALSFAHLDADVQMKLREAYRASLTELKEYYG